MMTSDHAPRDTEHSALVSAWREDRVDVDTDGETGVSTYRVTQRSDEDLPTVVVMTVAVATERPPTELPSLAAAVDPDAVHRFVTESPSSSAVLRFAYADCRVKVRSGGDVTVRRDAA